MTSLSGFGSGSSSVFRFGCGATEQSTYRGYTIGLAKHHSGWQISINPTRPELPILAYGTVTVPNPRKEEALAAAKRRIDLLLSI
jgi:hypothetical protein